MIILSYKKISNKIPNYIPLKKCKKKMNKNKIDNRKYQMFAWQNLQNMIILDYKKKYVKKFYVVRKKLLYLKKKNFHTNVAQYFLSN